MSKFVPSLLLSLLLSLSAPAFAGEAQVFAASTRGELLIDADGRVAELTLDRKGLGDEVMAAVEARVRSWRFEPVVEAGQPVGLKATLRLDMLAMRESETDGLTLAIRHVQFLDPPAPGKTGPGASVHAPKLQRPSYPKTAARA